MLFKPELCQAILDGHKTQSRRLVKDCEVAIHKPPGYAELPIEMVVSPGVLGRLKWAVGRTYAIQPGRGKKAIGRFLLTGIRREWLQDISEEDAIAEGCIIEVLEEALAGLYPHRQSFFRLWNSIHSKAGTCAEDNPEVWALELENAL